MGVWGTGPFDNDDALDFIGEVTALGTTEACQMVEHALRLPAGRVDYLVSAKAIAAASLVEASIGEPGDLPPEVRELTHRLHDYVSDEMVRSAHRVFVRIERGDTEWSQGWIDVETWATARLGLRDIRGRLSADPRVLGVLPDGQDALF